MIGFVVVLVKRVGVVMVPGFLVVSVTTFVGVLMTGFCLSWWGEGRAATTDWGVAVVTGFVVALVTSLVGVLMTGFCLSSWGAGSAVPAADVRAIERPGRGQ